MINKQNMLSGVRLALGFIFLWAFVDKTFGFGFSTTPEKSWLTGNSPTAGFLSGTKGPFASFFHSLAGFGIVDWLFMAGLLFIGLTMIFKKYVKWGAWAGMVMVLLMWLAVLPIVQNPIIDEHIVYFFVFGYFALASKDI